MVNKGYQTVAVESDFGLSHHGYEKRGLTKERKIMIAIIVVLLVVLVLGIGLGVGLRHHIWPENNEFNWADKMELNNLMGHLTDLEAIAMQHNGSRSVAFGYNASVQYIMTTLQNMTSWTPWIQYFNVTIFSTVASPSLSSVSPFAGNWTNGVDFSNMGGFSGEKNITANLTKVYDLGCNSSDYLQVAFPQGNIALVMRGNCTFEQKIAVAEAAGASAVLIYNDGVTPDRRGIFNGGLGSSIITIPVFALTYDLGVFLGDFNDTVTLYCYDSEDVYATSNVIVDTPFGSDDNIIVVGSHLDSVPAGPGINDDGSGSSANLELAIQLAQSGYQTTNKIRFCWWGAEEMGLLGSTFYVTNLVNTNPTEFKKIAMNLNFDMIGSPNYFVGLHDGSLAPPSCVNGSINIRNTFETVLNSSSIPFEYIDFDGRSDYGPFIAAGVPAGGVFTGAEGVKTMEERAIFGGLANAAFDPCYHAACDTVANINQDIYLKLAKTAASVLQTYSAQSDLKTYLN